MATRDIVPRNDGEGEIGTTAKRWLSGHFKTLYTQKIENDSSGDTPDYCLSSYDSWADAISSISTTVARLIVDTDATVSADSTVPSTLMVKVYPGCIITIATTKTLTINGVFDAGMYQVFSCEGTGQVAFGAFPVQIYPAWWGFSTSAAKAVNNAALTAAVGDNRSVVIEHGTYNIEQLVLEGISNCRIEGRGNVVLNGSTAGDSIIRLGNVSQAEATKCVFVEIYNIQLTSSATYTYGIEIQYMTDCVVRDVRVADTAITTALYINYSWNNKFYGFYASCPNAIVMGSSANNNGWFGGRLNADPAGGTGIYLRGSANGFYSLDISGYDVGVEVYSIQGFTLSGLYCEENKRDIKFTGIVTGGIISGCYFAKEAAETVNIGISHSDVYDINGVTITGNMFRQKATGIVLDSYFVDCSIFANNYQDCSTEISGEGGTHTVVNPGTGGTWTPVLYGASTAGTPTYTYQYGRYTRVGDVCYFVCRLRTSAITGIDGNLQISGLPYSSRTEDNLVVTGYVENGTGITLTATNTVAQWGIASGLNYISLSQGGAVASSYLTHANIAADTLICFEGFYFV